MPAEGGAGIMRLFLALACVFPAILPLALRAQDDRLNAPVAPYSCFSRQDYCLRNFAKTHDRDYYDLCLLSEKICRAYRYDWKFMSNFLYARPAFEEGIPAFSVGDLLYLCKGEEYWQKEGCHEHIVRWMAKADVRGEDWQAWTNRHLPVACTKAPSISEEEYIKAFVDWAEKHPSKQDAFPLDGLIAAAASAWPCPSVKVKRGRSH
jgi:hypothetical protein